MHPDYIVFKQFWRCWYTGVTAMCPNSGWLNIDQYSMNFSGKGDREKYLQQAVYWVDQYVAAVKRNGLVCFRDAGVIIEGEGAVDLPHNPRESHEHLPPAFR